MINVTVRYSEKKELEFPKLMAHNNDTDLVVFFESRTCGMCISEGFTSGHLGEYRTDWNPASFTDFHGTIKLEQSSRIKQ